MDNLIEIKNLEMSFPVRDALTGVIKGYVHALNGINLNIEKNEILGLVGESGSGKSTLGNCILNLLKPTSGSVLYGGENITLKSKKELKNFRKQTGLIFQNPYMSLNPRMKIYDILKEPFIIHGYKDNNKIDGEIKEIIKLTGFDEEILTRYPHEFSGGQRQRIAIARAVLLHPEFIVADEPVSALDVSIQAQIINLLLDIKQRYSLTMLFISHDISVVKCISDKIAVMYLGEIVETAPKKQFFENTLHPYSKALLSAVPNLNGIKKDKIPLNGDIPSPQSLPGGCKFHTRCPYAFDRCKTEVPELKACDENHFARCFLTEKNV